MVNGDRDMRLFREFLAEETGAVTADYTFWLTAVVWSGSVGVDAQFTALDGTTARITEALQSERIIYTRFEQRNDDGAFPSLAAAFDDRTTDAGAFTASLEDEGGNGNGGPNGNNGWGNGDQDAPGNSGPNNNAENGGGPPPPGLANGNANRHRHR